MAWTKQIKIKEIKIIKETEKAVAVEPLTGFDDKTIQFLYYTTRARLRNNCFWLPKSQITINGDYITHVSRFIINANETQWIDNPLIEEKEK